MKKVVIYARVSSKEQEKEGYSIPAQLELLRNYAKKNNFKIVKEFEDVETAKCSGRTNFNEMVKLIKNEDDLETILVEKTDRLYRNLPDYVTLDSLNIELHFVKESSIISSNSHSSEKLMHLIKVGMAKQYVDNLGEEVKKGLLQKAKEGYITGKQPHGYKKLNKRESVIDEVTAPFVRRAFELYAQGNLSLERVATQLRDEGYIYKDTQPRIYRSHLENILKNAFYYGMIPYKQELYQGKHEPLISKELFEQAQFAFRKDNKPKYIEPKKFLFAGMLKCSNCGCIVSGEIKKEKYIYYSCTGAKAPCTQKHIYLKEENIEKQIVEAIAQIYIDEQHKEWIKSILAESFKSEQSYTQERLHSLNTQKSKLVQRLEQIYIDKLDGKISEIFWREKHDEWKYDLSKIDVNITAHEKANINFIEESAKFLKICSEISELYKIANKQEKQELINYVLQNFFIEGETLQYEYKAPFDIFAKGLNCTKKLPRLDSNQ